MAEVFGVVAAATQLAGACLGLIDLMAKIKGARSTLLNFQNQLQEVHDISVSISLNPLLQTEDVYFCTQSLLHYITDNPLESLLRKRPISRTLGFIRKERDLANTLSSIEQRKSSLSLVISDIQARTLYNIHSDIRLIYCGYPEKSLPQSSSEKHQITDNLSEDLVSLRATMSNNASNKGVKRTPPMAEPDTEPVFHVQEASQLDPLPEEPLNAGFQGQQGSSVYGDGLSIYETLSGFVKEAIMDAKKQGQLNAWDSQYTGDGVHQWNGNKPGVSGAPAGSNIWIDNIKEGTSGNQYNYSQDPQRVSTPAGEREGLVMNIFSRNQHLGVRRAAVSGSSSTGVLPCQFNGFGHAPQALTPVPSTSAPAAARETTPPQ